MQCGSELSSSVQDSLASTGALAGLERLTPRLTLGSWSASRSQLPLAAAAMRAIAAAIASHPGNAAAYLQLNPLKPLVNCLALPMGSERAPVAAMSCLQALCAAAPAARAAAAAAGAIGALVAALQSGQKGLQAQMRTAYVEAAVRALAAIVKDTPDAQRIACKGVLKSRLVASCRCSFVAKFHAA